MLGTGCRLRQKRCDIAVCVECIAVAVDIVSSGVMQASYEPRICGDKQACCGQPSSDGRVIQQLGQYFYIDLSSLSASGTAIQAGCLGIVTGFAAMTQK